MKLNLPSETVFYTIERAIKAYRKFSQKKISQEINDITIDQGLVLQFLSKHPELTQKEIAELIFRDNASMTRMINTMVDKHYLSRSVNDQDRRRHIIEITPKGKEILLKIPPIIMQNRSKSLAGMPKNELIQLEQTLNKIISNINQN